MAGGLRCLIISTNEESTPYPVYPLGAAYVAGALRRRGHEARHYDLLADGGLDGLKALLAGEVYQLVGLSIRNLTPEENWVPGGYLQRLRGICEMVRQLQPKETRIVLGGAAFSIVPEEFVAGLGADYGIVGEGEELAPWLAGELAAGVVPPEKIYRAERVQSVARQVDLSESTVAYYMKRGGMLNLQTRRGCPHRCLYCSYPQIEGRTLRFRAADEVAAEALHLQNRYGARHLFFTDSVFNDPGGRYLEIAEALLRAGVTIPWSAFFRPQGLTVEALRLLKRSGLAAAELGTDAACDRTLRGLGKDFSMDDVFTCQQRMTEAEIPVAHFLIFGGPDETADTLEEGLDNITRLEPSVVFVFVGVRILPGTGIYRQALADGLVTREQSLIDPVYYLSPDIPMARLDTRIRDAFAGRLDRIYPCGGFDDRIALLHRLGHSGPLWDLLLRK